MNNFPAKNLIDHVRLFMGVNLVFYSEAITTSPWPCLLLKATKKQRLRVKLNVAYSILQLFLTYRCLSIIHVVLIRKEREVLVNIDQTVLLQVMEVIFRTVQEGEE